eukprot:GFUD01023932.1.p1 GENE.GFUD01023932.1~~GFUD01023932.1.p1  ORF type:complete len:403 (+),score=95.27 GFUD01023932.1:96-1304(+)
MHFLCVTLFVVKFSLSLSTEPTVVYDWSSIPINWPNTSWSRQHGGKTVNVIGIKVWEENIYLTVPRWHGNSHPLNVAVVPRPDDADTVPKSTSLSPYPSWEMQKIGDCDAFQFVQSMEVESDGLMWLPDNGRQFRVRGSTCSPKLVIMDLKTGKVVHRYNFPENIVPRSGSFLNDIALNVANPDDKFAYITDSDLGRLVVYSLKKDQSWLVQHSSMRADLAGATFSFLNPPARLRIADNNINGIAVSPAITGSKYVYYSPLTSLKMFRMDTAAVNSENVATSDVADVVVEVGEKRSQTDGLAMDNKGSLYMQEITGNALTVWNTSGPWRQDRLAQSNVSLIWADTMAVDKQGWLWATSRGWPVDSKPRIVKVFLGEQSKPWDFRGEEQSRKNCGTFCKILGL